MSDLTPLRSERPSPFQGEGGRHGRPGEVCIGKNYEH